MSDAACLLCVAERITEWHYEDDEVWVSDCMVCMTPMIVWREHGLPDADSEERFLTVLKQIAAERYPDGHRIDAERRKIPDHWHAHARPVDSFFDPRSELYDKDWREEADLK